LICFFFFQVIWFWNSNLYIISFIDLCDKRAIETRGRGDQQQIPHFFSRFPRVYSANLLILTPLPKAWQNKSVFWSSPFRFGKFSFRHFTDFSKFSQTLFTDFPSWPTNQVFFQLFPIFFTEIKFFFLIKKHKIEFYKFSRRNRNGKKMFNRTKSRSTTTTIPRRRRRRQNEQQSDLTNTQQMNSLFGIKRVSSQLQY
jgi:hypothetical protein